MKTAMILAAGRGERLRPITDNKPKPLCVIHDKPLIEHHVQNLAQAGFNNIVINHAYLGGMIRDYLGNGERYKVQIQYSPEPPGGLETAGGILNALPMLGNTPFVVVNVDIYTDYDFSHLSLAKSQLAHLVLVDKTAHYNQGNFGLCHNGLIDNEKREYIFSGIACYHPKIFSQLKPGRFSITPILRQLANDKLVSGEHHKGEWLEIGTQAQLISAGGR
jgi:MurNAc alpha-1-phosphate uridylyltransferase